MAQLNKEGGRMYYPMLLKAPLKDYLWGGQKLIREYGKVTDLDKVAESWEVSCHPDGYSIIENGFYQNQTLSAYIEKEGKGVLGKRSERFSEFPILIKLIDASDNLSLQVHPDDHYASEHEGGLGKTEMWYVVDCEPGAELIMGFSKHCDKEEVEKRIKDDSLLDICKHIPVKRGDVFFIEAGTLHAIGKGMLIAEVQENSNVTYRVYDYGRKDKQGNERELHTKKALEVMKLEPVKERKSVIDRIVDTDHYKAVLLENCRYFKVAEVEIKFTANFTATDETFQTLTILDGEAVIKHLDMELEVTKGNSVFIPAGMGGYEISGKVKFLFCQL